MALIVEDGTLVPNANTYASVSALKAYADARGIVLTGSDADLERALILAMDKLNDYRSQYAGTRRRGAELLWPRDDVYIDGSPFANNEIPAELIRAQLIYAVLINSGAEMYANSTSDTRILKREKIDVLEFEYAVPEGSEAGVVFQPIFAEAEKYLSVLFDGGISSINSYLVRV